MPSQDEHNNQTDPSIDTDRSAEDVANPLKALSLAIGGLILLLSIFALLPLFFTYLSEGDSRAPSEIHPTDSARKSDYHLAKPKNGDNIPKEKTGGY